jgi:hypothetical protein
LEIYDEDVGSDELIGKIIIPLVELIAFNQNPVVKDYEILN